MGKRSGRKGRHNRSTQDFLRIINGAQHPYVDVATKNHVLPNALFLYSHSTHKSQEVKSAPVPTHVEIWPFQNGSIVFARPLDISDHPPIGVPEYIAQTLPTLKPLELTEQQRFVFLLMMFRSLWDEELDFWGKKFNMRDEAAEAKHNWEHALGKGDVENLLRIGMTFGWKILQHHYEHHVPDSATFWNFNPLLDERSLPGLDADIADIEQYMTHPLCIIKDEGRWRSVANIADQDTEERITGIIGENHSRDICTSHKNQPSARFDNRKLENKDAAVGSCETLEDVENSTKERAAGSSESLETPNAENMPYLVRLRFQLGANMHDLEPKLHKLDELIYGSRVRQELSHKDSEDMSLITKLNPKLEKVAVDGNALRHYAKKIAAKATEILENDTAKVTTVQIKNRTSLVVDYDTMQLERDYAVRGLEAARQIAGFAPKVFGEEVFAYGGVIYGVPQGWELKIDEVNINGIR